MRCLPPKMNLFGPVFICSFDWLVSHSQLSESCTQPGTQRMTRQDNNRRFYLHNKKTSRWARHGPDGLQMAEMSLSASTDDPTFGESWEDLRTRLWQTLDQIVVPWGCAQELLTLDLIENIRLLSKQIQGVTLLLTGTLKRPRRPSSPTI